jgi:hypothetical protein
MAPTPSAIAQTTWLVAGMIALTTGGLAANPRPDGAPGVHIECVTPDGQAGHVSRLAAVNPGAAALIMEDDTVTCLLQEGETNFVIELPKARLLDRLTFLNENAVARGELKIAVSNQRLKADSDGWLEVEGIVPFTHKRLFGVSLVGIEAKFIRLSFRVEKAGRIAAFSSEANEPAEKDPVTAPTEKPFSVSALEEALDSKFAALPARDTVLLAAGAASVAPLSSAPR